MSIEHLHVPDDASWHAARAQDVTASVAAALLGVHEFETPLSLFMAKSCRATPDEESAPMRRGRLLEPVAVQVLREEHPGWTIRYNAGADRHYYRDTAARIGCTPDVEAYDPARGLGAVQIKSVEASIYRRKWLDEDREPTPPVWIAIQALIEASLIGAQWAAVAPIVVGHGVELPLIDIPLTPGLMKRIRAEVAEFWRRVEANEPYPVDFARDGAIIASLFADPDERVIADMTADNHLPEIAAEDMILADEIKVKTARRKEIKAEFSFKIGNCGGVIFNGGSATKKMVHKKAYAVAASSYQDVRIKLEKAAQ